jgi:hypothetical protein
VKEIVRYRPVQPFVVSARFQKDLVQAVRINKAGHERFNLLYCENFLPQDLGERELQD